MQSDERLLVGFLWLGLCLPRTTKVQISFRVLLQSDQRHFLRFTKAWFVLTVNTKGADQP